MIIHNPVITGSLQVNGSSVSSIEQLDSVSGSVAALNNATSSYLQNTTDTLTGDLTVTGTLTAQEFHTEYVSGSIIYESGSTKFGDSTDDSHDFTGSISIQSAGASGLVLETDTSNSSNSGRLFFMNNSTGTAIMNEGGLLTLRTGASPASTSGTQRMSIDSSGVVVIGNGTTSGTLEFENDVKTRKIVLYPGGNNDNQFYGFGIEDSKLVYSVWQTGDDHVFFAGTSSSTRNELMRIRGNGNVGIGNDTPGADLHIGDVETTPAGTAGTIDRLHIHPYSNTGGPYKYIARTINGSEDYLDMYYGSTHIASYGLTGNVGIGQTKPTGSLHITSGNNHAYLGDLEGNSTMVLRMSDNAAYPVEVQAHGTELRFNTATTSGATPSMKMKIQADGNVGIGADSPIANLHISGSSNTQIRVDAGPNGSASLRLRNDAHDWDVNCQTNDKFAIYSHTDTTERLVILPSTGNVGIGVVTPSAKLHVGGTAAFDSNVTVASGADIRTVDGYGIRLRNAANTANEGGFVRSGLWEGDSSRDPSLFAETGLGLRFYTNGSATEKMFINTSGYVGIGTNNPQTALTLPQGTGAANKISWYDGTPNFAASIYANSSNDTLTFSTKNASNVETIAMVIDIDQHVGIGTTDPTCHLQFGNVVSSNSFTNFSDYQIILYKDASAPNSYGFGIEDNALMMNTNTRFNFYRQNTKFAHLAYDVSSISNSDAGNQVYENKGGRLLTSNGTGWLGDGRDPILTLATAGDSNNTSIAESIGLNLYTAATTNGIHSPAIAFSNRSNSGNYESAFGIIIAKKTGTGVDTNWSAGELHFYTGKESAYMDNNPDLKIDAAGRVTKIRTPYFEAYNTAAITVTTTDSKLALGGENNDIGSNYNSSTYRFTAPVAGRYLFTLSSSVNALGGGTFNAIYITKNGNGTSFRFRAPGNLSSSTWGGIAGSAILNLAASDYVELNAYTQSGTITLQANETRWCGYLLG